MKRTMAETANFYEPPAVKFMPALYPKLYAYGYLRDHQDLIPDEVKEVLPVNPRPKDIFEAWAEWSGEDIDVALRSMANAYLRLSGIRRY